MSSSALLLLLVLGLLVLQVVTGALTAARLERLEGRLRERPVGDPDGPVRFSRAVLDGEPRRLLPDLEVPASSMVLLGTGPSCLEVAVDLVRTQVEQGRTALLAGPSLSEEALAPALGEAVRGGAGKVPPDDLLLLSGLSIEPRRLLEACLRRSEGLGVVAVEPVNLFPGRTPAEHLRVLHRISRHCPAPLAVLLPVGSPGWEAALAERHRFAAVREVGGA